MKFLGAINDNKDLITKEYLETQINLLQAELGKKAPINSADLTGIPTAPTAVKETNTTQIATTAFVREAILGSGGIDVKTSSAQPVNQKTNDFWYKII